MVRGRYSVVHGRWSMVRPTSHGNTFSGSRGGRQRDLSTNLRKNPGQVNTKVQKGKESRDKREQDTGDGYFDNWHGARHGREHAEYIGTNVLI
jgi:hypothetical protein